MRGSRVRIMAGAPQTTGTKMSQLRIDANDMFTIDITVRESDEYSKNVFVKFERNFYCSGNECDEMFLTVDQLESLGRFLCRQADDIRCTQANRK